MRLLDKMLTKINYKNKNENENIKLSYRYTKRSEKTTSSSWSWMQLQSRVGEGYEVKGWERYGARVAYKALLHTHAMGGTKDRFDFKSGIVQ